MAKTPKDTVLIAARVPKDIADLFDAAAFVRRVSMQGLLAPALVAFGNELQKDEYVISALNARRASDGPGASVSSIVNRNPAK